MKIAGMVLGIVGGVLSIIFALIFIFSGSMVGYFTGTPEFNSELDAALEGYGSANWDEWDSEWNDFDFDFNLNSEDGFRMNYNDDFANFNMDIDGLPNANAIARGAVNAVSFWMIAAGIAGLIGGILGIIGGAIIRKKRIASGVMLVIAAVLSIFTGLGFLASIMLIIACIFAFIQEKPPLPPMQPQYPQPEQPQPQPTQPVPPSGPWPQP